MNKYIYSECTQDYFPEIKTLMANSYNDAVEKLAEKYAIQLDDDNINEYNDDFLALREYLNENHIIALSEIEIIDEL